MALFAWFFRLVWGNDVDRALRPVLAVTFVGSAAFSAGWIFVGIWAVDELDATSRQVGFAFLAGALVSMVAGYAGGHLSDHVGRRPMILAGWACLAATFLAYAFVGKRTDLGLSLMVLAGIGGSIGNGADQAMVADLVPPDRHEAGYAATRVASNLGVAFGPPIGGVLLIGRHWPVLFVGVCTMALAAIAIAFRYLPRTGEYRPEEPPARGSFGALRSDRAFLLFLVSGALAYLVYVAYETVLPISAVKSHGISPSTWGFIVIINPVLVTLFQLRVTRWSARFPAGPKLVTAMLVMGGSFLFLLWSGSLAMFVWVMVVFVIGEMLWVPTSQAIVAALAPEDIRGAYMGAFGSTASIGFALGPFTALQLRGAYGDAAAWYFFAAVSVVAAATGAAAVRGSLARRRVDAPAAGY
ncbi:MAG TPA: MFS transporter [Acidimicrobiia bacterium]|nr:MFS transporter [Acidimicrobiia bacterium]